MSESGLPGTPTAGVARSAGLVGIATMASRVLGLVRDWVFLTAFGAGHVMDAYNVAFRLPNLVRDLFAEGAMSAAFVPTFTRELHGRARKPPGSSGGSSSPACWSSRASSPWPASCSPVR